MVEGPRVVEEALRASWELRFLFVGEEFSGTKRGERILAAAERRGVTAELAPDEDVRRLGRTKTPQPVLAVAKTKPLLSARERGRYLWLDGVRDPGNAGTLTRSAWAFGLDGVIWGRGSVDPWNPKTIRASAGSVFHVPLFSGCDALGLIAYRADASGEPVGEIEVPTEGWILLVGSETRAGASADRSEDRLVSVPMETAVDSLNASVAGSILIWAMTRIRR